MGESRRTAWPGVNLVRGLRLPLALVALPGLPLGAALLELLGMVTLRQNAVIVSAGSVTTNRPLPSTQEKPAGCRRKK